MIVSLYEVQHIRIFGYNVKVIPIETLITIRFSYVHKKKKKKDMFLLHFVASSRRNFKIPAYVIALWAAFLFLLKMKQVSALVICLIKVICLLQVSALNSLYT